MERIRLESARLRAAGVFFSVLSALLVSACGSGQSGGSLGFDSGVRRELPSADEVASSDERLNIAVKYVAFVNSSGTAVASEQAVRDALAYSSRIWEQCNITLELVSYQTLDPSSIDESYNPGTYSEIDRIRMALQDDRHMLLVGTGTWGRSSNLGSANCYSSFPGDDADGVICELKSAASPTLIAHEVGHWFDLRHTNDPSTDYVDDTHSGNVGYNLMGSVVATSDTDLTLGQCERARRTVGESRRNTVL